MTNSMVKHSTDMVTNASQMATMIPTISYHALKKSIPNFQVVTRFYFSLHGVSEAEMSEFIPLLMFTEATIYQFDEEYEIHVNDPNFISEHLSTLRDVLIQLNLFDNKIETELQHGLTYYRLEQQFCSGGIPTEEDIEKASLFKCTDSAILQRILFKLTAQPYDEEMLSISRRFDQISKIHTDLEDYNEDVRRNVINIYRIFVRLYGSEAPQHMQHYLEKLNSNVQHQLYLLAQTRPELTKKFIELWNAELLVFPMPGIPEPILEDFNVLADTLHK